ncbi:MAG: hypothetical protein OXI40_17785 [Chloroflexota bacterium]|nr:hypothetical protein [Chloroflexota bacterium]
MDDSTLAVYVILFVMITIVLVYSARYFLARRARRLSLQAAPGFPRLSGWLREAIEAGKPLHLSFGSAGIDRDNAAVAAAEAELFYHIIKAARAGDVAPVISTSSAATIPLCQDTIRRAWAGDDRRARAQWFPGGARSMAFAAGLTATMGVEDPAAHILAGSFGPELALILDSADRQGQGSFAVSDQLEGNAIAFAMADEVLIGEQLFSAAAWLSPESTARIDASVQDVWRGLLIALMAILMLIEVAGQLQIAGWSLVVGAALALAFIGLMFVRRR